MIELYTDGSAIDNPGPGGWGAIVLGRSDELPEVDLSGCEPESTNNRMELMAVIEGLNWILEQEGIVVESGTHDPNAGQGLFADPASSLQQADISKVCDRPIHIYTDSTYVQKGITEWMETRLRRNRRLSKGGKLVKNVDLWKRLNATVEKCTSLQWSWVKAHVGHEFNERVDDLAREAVIAQT